MFGNKKSRLEKVRETASEALHGVGETLQGTLHEVIEHAPEKLGGIKHSAGDALHAAVSNLSTRAESLRDVAETLREKAEVLREQAADYGSHYAEAARETAGSAKESAFAAKDNVISSARKMKKGREKQARDAANQAQERAEETEREAVAHAPEVVVQSSNDKWLWLLVGIGIGALVGVLLAPNQGRRTRAALKDKLAGGASAAGGLGGNAARKAQHLTNRATGLAHELGARARGEGEDAGDDVTIADRVRSELGHLEKSQSWNIERINVDSCDGVVTLRGPVADITIADALVATAEKVLGVREVKNELNAEQEGEAFVG